MKARERIIAKDKYGTKILLIKNTGENSGYDFLTDGRVLLSPALARKLSRELLKFADRSKP